MYKNLLVLPDGTELLSGVGTTNAIKNMKLTNLVNSGEELIIGSVCCSEIEVSIFTPCGGLSLTSGDEVTLYKVNSSGNRIQMGVFSVRNPTRPTANTMKVIGYDRVSKLDKDLTSWLASLNEWPYTVNEFASLVCSACGLVFRANTGIPNASFQITQWSKGIVTGRQIMRWLGEIVCRFVRATPDGEIEFGWYADSDKAYEGSGNNYYFAGSFSHENYQVSPVDSVQLRLADSESGVLWPAADDGANSYIITGNPILLSCVTEELLPYLEAIQAELAGLTYTPCEFSIPADPGLKAGDIVRITDANNKTVIAYVMTKTNSGQRDTITCTGSFRRDGTSAAYNKTENEKKAEAEANSKLKLTQDNVFNALTNDGEVQGFFMKDGQVYVNVSYLVTGILKSKDGKTFYLDLDDGILKMQATEFSISGKTVDDIAQEKADAAAKSAVNSQTQEDIFNKLTNNGNLKGMFMKNGQLYINASYLSTGILSSKDQKTFYLDLDKGILKMNANEFLIAGQTVDKIAEDKAETAVGAQTQEDIFNKLTNNGKAPGLFMEDGQLYINTDYLATGIIKSKDGTISLDLGGNSFVVSMPSNGAARTMNFLSSGLWGYGEDTDTGDLYPVLIIQPAILGANGSKTTNIASSSGADLVLSASASAYAAAGFVQIGTVASSKVKIKGKTVSWKDNGDGTFTLIGQ